MCENILCLLNFYFTFKRGKCALTSPAQSYLIQYQEPYGSQQHLLVFRQWLMVPKQAYITEETNP